MTTTRKAKRVQARTAEVGDLEIDGAGRSGVVISRSDHPDDAWLAIQSDPRMRMCSADDWWLVYPLTGGAVLQPASLLTRLRRATAFDVELAMDAANPSGRRRLVEILSAMVEAP